MTSRFVRGALAALAFFALSQRADAAIHVARVGETLGQLSLRYYGKMELSFVIRAANGFIHPDDGQLMPGERIEIPEVTYHRVRQGETWETLADRYLGSSRRGRFLAEMNKEEQGNAPAEGAVVVIPYQLLHILSADESIRSVTKIYFGAERSPNWLVDYNLAKKKKRFGRGDAVLVPLANLRIVPAELERIKTEQAENDSQDAHQGQIEAAAEIARLRDQFDQGRYVEIVATAERLLGKGSLTSPQQIGVYKYLSFAYVALGNQKLATNAFKRALEIEPSMELSPITTSPKIMKIFQAARKEVLDAAAGSDQGRSK